MDMETAPKIAKRERKMRQSLAFGRNLIVLALIILIPGLWAAYKSALTLRWPRADAKVVDARLRLQTMPNNSTTQRRQQPDVTASFHVLYSYSVGGREYLSSRVEPYDFGMQNSAGARKMQDRHPVGSTAKVAYDPDDPTVSYIEPGPSSMSLMMVGIGVVIAASGLWVRSLAKRGIGEMAT
jgi:hypothetical protein